MKEHAVHHFKGRQDHVLVYVPSLRKLMTVSSRQADRIPASVTSEDEAVVDEGPKAYPPRFNKVTFYLSDRCNMRCRYCYAESNTSNEVLSEGQIQSSLDYFFQNTNHEKVVIRFLGGEPTAVWDTLVFTVDYARRQAEKWDKEVGFTMDSNGLWSPAQHDFITKHFFHIGISIDGPPEIHNVHRPLVSGHDSFDRVYGTVKKLHAGGSMDIKLCPVISNLSVERMPEMTASFCKALPGVTIFYTPLDEIGAGMSMENIQAPSISLFLEKFIDSLKLADELGSGNTIMTSVMDLHSPPSTRFCGCDGDNFIVLPSGWVTSCSKATKRYGDQRDIFIYGRVDNDGVCFQQKRYEDLARFDASNIKACRDCFAAYICRGGCPLLKSFAGPDFWSIPDPNCYDIKKAVLRYLWYLAGRPEEFC